MEGAFSSLRVLATPSLRNPTELCTTQQVPALTAVPARRSCSYCAACSGAGGGQEGVTLLCVREAPGSLSASPGAAGSPHPRAASDGRTGAQWSSPGSSSHMHGGESEPGRVAWTYRPPWEDAWRENSPSLEIVWATSSGSQCTLNTGGLMSKLCCLGQKNLVHFQGISAGISSLAPGTSGLGPEGRRRDGVRCHRGGIHLTLSNP